MSATGRAMQRLEQFRADLERGKAASAADCLKEFRLMLLEVEDENLRAVLLGWATLWAYQFRSEAVREIRDEVAEHRRRIEDALGRAGLA